MWCLVSQANSVILEVQVDPKAIGQECLEKACDYLGISKECDYFGLKYQNAKGEELWLNLRNPIERQTGGGVVPVRFALRVKFWVPPHLLLQEATRPVGLGLPIAQLSTPEASVTTIKHDRSWFRDSPNYFGVYG